MSRSRSRDNDRHRHNLKSSKHKDKSVSKSKRSHHNHSDDDYDSDKHSNSELRKYHKKLRTPPEEDLNDSEDEYDYSKHYKRDRNSSRHRSPDYRIRDNTYQNDSKEENNSKRKKRKNRSRTPEDLVKRKADSREEVNSSKQSKRKEVSPESKRKYDFREEENERRIRMKKSVSPDNKRKRNDIREKSDTPDSKRERNLLRKEKELDKRSKRKERSKTPTEKSKRDLKEDNQNDRRRRKERSRTPDYGRREIRGTEDRYEDLDERTNRNEGSDEKRKEKGRRFDNKMKRDFRGEEENFNKSRKRKERSRTPEYVKRKKADSERNTNKETSGDIKKNKTGMTDNPLGENTSKSAADTPQNPSVIPPSQKKTVDILTSRTGGAYIPPAKLRMMQAEITDKSSAAYQRIAWEALKKSIHGHINKVNTSNIGIIVRELFRENVVRGRGLLTRSIIQAQAASPTFTHVYAALVSVINSKFPNIGELLLKRLVIQFRRGFKRNDKSLCISSATFIAHLVNQRVAHEILALEILTLLVESPTDDSVEVAIAFLKECGMKLMEVSNKGVHAIFEMLRNILHEGKLDKRVQYMIEVIFQVRKDEFRDHVAVLEELDLVEEEDQFTHLITLDEATNPEDLLNVFKFDEEYEQTEAKYAALRKEILDEDSDSSEDGSGSENEEDESEESENEESKDTTIIDNTETNLIALRRTIYLTIHSSLDFEECAHKLLRMELKPGQEIELCHMFLDCCAEQRTYEKFFGLLAQRFCQINKIYIPPFQQIFKDTYDTIHRLDTNKLRNVAKFFAHLLFTDAISWEVLSFIHLNEEETTSSSRIFIKILFQELCEYMGLTKLNTRIKDPTLQIAFDGLFPRDNPKNTRFAINFFTSIGLGGLTDELREHLKSQPKTPVVPKLMEALAAESTDSSDDSDEEESDSSDDESEKESNRKKNKDKASKKKKKKKHRSRSDSKHKSDKSSNCSRHDEKKKKKNKR